MLRVCSLSVPFSQHATLLHLFSRSSGFPQLALATPLKKIATDGQTLTRKACRRRALRNSETQQMGTLIAMNVNANMKAKKATHKWEKEGNKGAQMMLPT